MTDEFASAALSRRDKIASMGMLIGDPMAVYESLARTRVYITALSMLGSNVREAIRSDYCSR